MQDMLLYLSTYQLFTCIYIVNLESRNEHESGNASIRCLHEINFECEQLPQGLRVCDKNLVLYTTKTSLVTVDAPQLLH
jgi:hypothetical protein